MRSIWVGYDQRENAAFAVARHSMHRHMTQQIPIRGLLLDDLRSRGLYTRPTEVRISSEGRCQLWDVISEAPMSTQHANARFLIPSVAGGDWALFTDGDVLLRGNIARLFDLADSQFAVMCVKHDHVPANAMKMDGQVQSKYSRKNWSSVMLFNCRHEANAALTVDLVNSVPGRDLHRFCWLDDAEIGALPPEWNHLVGHSDNPDPQLVHFTDGVPDMPGYENVPYADEWRAELNDWAA